MKICRFFCLTFSCEVSFVGGFSKRDIFCTVKEIIDAIRLPTKKKAVKECSKSNRFHCIGDRDFFQNKHL